MVFANSGKRRTEAIIECIYILMETCRFMFRKAEWYDKGEARLEEPEGRNSVLKAEETQDLFCDIIQGEDEKECDFPESR